MRICIPLTAARVEPGKTYRALIGREPSFLYLWVTATSAMTPVTLTATSVPSRGSESIDPPAPSTTK
jgi:hypothetical protein